MTLYLGYILCSLMGLTLGLVGAGGSILTMPILIGMVYGIRLSK